MWVDAYVHGEYCAQILANSITNWRMSRVWPDPLSTRLELAAATRSDGRSRPVPCASPPPTLIGCLWRHRLIIAAAEAAILTTATTWLIMPIRLVWMSVIPRPTVYHDWSITTKFGRQVYTCPRTRVSLFGSRLPHFGCQREQESLANAKVNARQHRFSLSCLCNSLTQIEWVVQLLLPPKHAKSREIHPRSSILLSVESPYVTSY